MPQLRKYNSHALRQAAYRQRTRRSQAERLLQRGLPAGPAIATMPGTVRWTAAIKQSKDLIDMVVQEMQDYHDERSELWQEGPQGEAFLERMESIGEICDMIAAIGQ